MQSSRVSKHPSLRAASDPSVAASTRSSVNSRDWWIKLVENSSFPGSSAPSEITWQPLESMPGYRTGSRALVSQRTMSAPSTASSTDSTASQGSDESQR